MSCKNELAIPCVQWLISTKPGFLLRNNTLQLSRSIQRSFNCNKSMHSFWSIVYKWKLLLCCVFISLNRKQRLIALGLIEDNTYSSLTYLSWEPFLLEHMFRPDTNCYNHCWDSNLYAAYSLINIKGQITWCDSKFDKNCFSCEHCHWYSCKSFWDEVIVTITSGEPSHRDQCNLLLASISVAIIATPCELALNN